MHAETSLGMFFCISSSSSATTTTTLVFQAELFVSLLCVMLCRAQGWEALNLHSWKAYDKGQDIHLQGVPSQVNSNAMSSSICALLPSLGPPGQTCLDANTAFPDLQAEVLYKTYKDKKKTLDTKNKSSIEDTYGKQRFRPLFVHIHQP